MTMGEQVLSRLAWTAGGPPGAVSRPAWTTVHTGYKIAPSGRGELGFDFGDGGEDMGGAVRVAVYVLAFGHATQD